MAMEVFSFFLKNTYFGQFLYYFILQNKITCSAKHKEIWQIKYYISQPNNVRGVAIK